MKARRGGSCANECGHTIRQGDEITRGPQGWQHADCEPQPLQVYAEQTPQPDGAPRCWVFWQRRGNRKPVKHLVKARLLQPLPRYDCGVTTGSGFWKRHVGDDPAGAELEVYGYFDDGRYICHLPRGGCGDLPVRQVELLEPLPEMR
jgi:hypothetical protein